MIKDDCGILSIRFRPKKTLLDLPIGAESSRPIVTDRYQRRAQATRNRHSDRPKFARHIVPRLINVYPPIPMWVERAQSNDIRLIQLAFFDKLSTCQASSLPALLDTMPFERCKLGGPD